jgi:excisionase family DNA binding protein
MPKVKQKPKEKLLRVNQVAYRLNVSESSVYRWCDHGLLEKVKLTNGLVRITETSLNVFIENGFRRGLD